MHHVAHVLFMDELVLGLSLFSIVFPQTMITLVFAAHCYSMLCVELVVSSIEQHLQLDATNVSHAVDPSQIQLNTNDVTTTNLDIETYTTAQRILTHARAREIKRILQACSAMCRYRYFKSQLRHMSDASVLSASQNRNTPRKQL